MNFINKANQILAMESFPLHPSPSHSIQCQPTLVTHQDLYDLRLNSYLHRKRSSHTPATHKIKKTQLSEASREIRQCYDFIEALRQQINTITSKVESPSSDWGQELPGIRAEFDVVSKRINELINRRNDIQESVNARQQKRDRIKLRKASTKQRKQMEMKNRSDKCRTIDEWLKKESEHKQEAQHEIHEKQQIQNSVADIRQKIDEATKQLSLLKSLQKLHQLREREKTTKHDCSKDFNNEINELISMWTLALDRYKNEENKQRKQFTTQDQGNDWLSVHFGMDASTVKDVDNIEALVWNRRMWDLFLTSKENPWSSNIPIGWITPPSNPTDAWSQYRND